MDDDSKSSAHDFLYGRSLRLPRLPLLACAYFGPASFIVLQLSNYGRSCGTLGAVKEFDGHEKALTLTSPLSQIYAQCVNAKTEIMIGVVLFIALHLFLKMAVLLRPKRPNEYNGNRGNSSQGSRKSSPRNEM